MRLSLLGCLLVGSLGCYHATVETGATPSTQRVTKGFASGWIYGLVPPSTVETAARCPNGAARIETKISFVNGLVSLLTLSIYSPMSIEVTCAAASGAGENATPVIRAGGSAEERKEAVDEAARRSHEADGAPITVVFE